MGIKIISFKQNKWKLFSNSLWNVKILFHWKLQSVWYSLNLLSKCRIYRFWLKHGLTGTCSLLWGPSKFGMHTVWYFKAIWPCAEYNQYFIVLLKDKNKNKKYIYLNMYLYIHICILRHRKCVYFCDVYEGSLNEHRPLDLSLDWSYPENISILTWEKKLDYLLNVIYIIKNYIAYVMPINNWSKLII